MRSLRHLVPAALLLGLSISAAGGTLADDKKAPEKPAAPAAAVAYDAEVLVLHATNGDKGIDPRIGDMPELKRPPFSSYKSYELLQKVRHPLEKDPGRTLDLPNGRKLNTKLVEVLPNDEVRFTASINKPDEKKAFLPLLAVKAKPGQSFIVAGQSHKNGILVLVIRVVK